MDKKRKPLHQLVRKHERSLLPLRRFLREEYAAGGGQATIFIRLPDSPYNPFSVPRQRALRTDLFAFIDEKAYPIPLHMSIRLSISGAPQGEEAQVKDLIREHYNLRLQDKRYDLKMNAILCTVLLIIGLLALAANIWMGQPIPGLPLKELMSLVVWFALWEAADTLVFERSELRLHYLMTGQLAIAEVDFVTEQEQSAQGHPSP